MDRAARIQHDAQDLPRPDRDRGGPALSAARDRAGHLRQLRQRGDDRAQEAAVRYRADRQELPQRDHPGQLHLPHPRVRADGDGILRRAGDRPEWHQYWIDTRLQWYVDLGIDPENLRLFEHPKDKLSHYSDRTVDIEYKFGFSGNPWGELEGVANRTDFDLSTHAKHSGVDLSFYDQATDTRYTPYVIEPAAGLTRSFMAFLIDAYTEDEAPNAKGGMDKRTVLRLDPRLAPVKAAVLPLSRHADLSPKARDLAAELRKCWNIDFDDAGAIGRRYRRQDEIGTPFCVTVDFDSLEDHAVTVRERDAMTQERVAIDAVADYLAVRLKGVYPRDALRERACLSVDTPGKFIRSLQHRASRGGCSGQLGSCVAVGEAGAFGSCVFGCVDCAGLHRDGRVEVGRAEVVASGWGRATCHRWTRRACGVGRS